MDEAAGLRHSASFVVPAFNERSTIHSVVAACDETGRQLVESGELSGFEIVLVDDASTDGTAEICDSLAATRDEVVVRHHERNRTLGATLRTGFEAASGDYLIYTDADLPFDLGELHKAFRLLRYYDADLICAYRFSRAGEGLTRLVYSHAYNLLIRCAFGLKVRDVNFAAKVLKREVIDKVELESEGSFIDAELLVRAASAGFDTIQFGVDYFPRRHGQSTLSSPTTIWRMLLEMRRLGPGMRREARDRCLQDS